MLVSDILAGKELRLITIAAGAPIVEAARLLKEERIGALVVTDPQGGLQAILSERDIARAVADRGAALSGMRVAELMTSQVVTCSPETEVDELVRLMTERRVRHLPVLEDGRLIGMISIGDVLKSRMQELESETSALREYIAG